MDRSVFCTDKKCNSSRYCFVDIAILLNDEVKVVIEIEESDIRPVAICGKLFISALASHFIHESSRRMADAAHFIQLIDTRKLTDRSSKLAQCEHLMSSFQHLLQAVGKNVTYHLHYGKVARFCMEEDQRALLDDLRFALAE